MKIGADPELFLADRSGKYISSVGLIGGTKEEPKPLPMAGCAVQEDNVAVEFNIPPCDSVDSFIAAIQYNLDYLTKEVATRGLSLVITPSASFPPDQLQSRQAKVFGCDPDYNAWTGGINPKPFARNKNLRSAGGHIHVGFDGEDLEPFSVVRAMDVFLAIPSLELDPDTERRLLYGKAGACRPKPYGVEYRTLSNFWIATPELRNWAYTQTLTAVNFVRNGGSFSDEQGEAIQYCVNSGNKELAKAIKAEYGIA